MPHRWPAWAASDLGYCLLVYVGTRLAVLLGAVAALAAHPGQVLARTAYAWDGWWYLALAQHGYTSTLRPQVEGWHHRYSDWAFYPAYPLLVRLVHEITFLPYGGAGLVTSALTGFAAVYAVHQLGAQHSGRAAGRTAALLLAAWPGSAALSLPYGEGLFTAATAFGLNCLLRRQWLLAGVAGFVSTTTRATGLALLAAAAVTAVLEVHRTRRLAPLAAPLLTAGGTLAFLGYGYARTGDPLVWRHAENLWNQRLDLSISMVRSWEQHLPSARGPEVLQVLGAIGLLWLVAAAFPVRLRDPVVVYSAVAVVLVVGYSAVGTRPRMVLGAFPLFVLAGRHLHPRGRTLLSAGWTVLLGVVTFMWLRTVTP